MNISSIVIYLKNKNMLNNVTDELAKFQEIEIITSQDDKIVALIQSIDVDAEIAVFRHIEALYGVLNVAMIYSYQEELEQDLLKLNETINSGKIAAVLARDDVDAKEIHYGGKVPLR